MAASHAPYPPTPIRNGGCVCFMCFMRGSGGGGGQQESSFALKPNLLIWGRGRGRLPRYLEGGGAAPVGGGLSACSQPLSSWGMVRTPCKTPLPRTAGMETNPLSLVESEGRSWKAQGSSTPEVSWVES